MTTTPLHSLSAMAMTLTSLLASCATLSTSHNDSKPGSFASVIPVLESNCVHCHGENHLAHMPPFGDTQQLTSLVNTGQWISPGHPDKSRFFGVVAMDDTETGAMPPTGHAISDQEMELLRAWIEQGAPIPQGPVIKLTPKGTQPRSR